MNWIVAEKILSSPKRLLQSTIEYPYYYKLVLLYKNSNKYKKVEIKVLSVLDIKIKE